MDRVTSRESQGPRASVVIATRNRREELLRTVRACLRQTYPSLEVLVYDDASSDGTLEAVRREFPQLRASRSEPHVGYIALRNRGFREARGEFVFSLDDDSYFTCENTVSRTVALFDENPKAAAIALPYVEPHTNDPAKKMRVAPDDQRLRSYVGCAHALRRQVALDLGGYREFLIHQGEERDLSIRMLDRGYEVFYGDTQPLVHTYSEQRDLERLQHFGVRNTLLFDVLNVPWPYVGVRILSDVVKLFWHKLSPWNVHQRTWYVVLGLGACVRHLGSRSPVRRETYVKYRSMPVHGPLWESPAEESDSSPVNTDEDSHDSRFEMPCVGTPG
jgi:glycosyltransferase involved in cell wall biosynthesis